MGRASRPSLRHRRNDQPCYGPAGVPRSALRSSCASGRRTIAALIRTCCDCPLVASYALPAPGHASRRSLVPMPFGGFHSGHDPRDRPYRRAGYETADRAPGYIRPTVASARNTPHATKSGPLKRAPLRTDPNASKFVSHPDVVLFAVFDQCLGGGQHAQLMNASLDIG